MKGMMMAFKFHTVTFKIVSIKNRKSKVKAGKLILFNSASSF